MIPYKNKTDSGGKIHPDLELMQLQLGSKIRPDDIASGIFAGRELVVDAGGSKPSWIICLDDLNTAYRMPPSEKEERDLIHLAESSASSVYIEAPFGSYRLPNRLQVVKAMENNNVPFFMLDSKYTTRTYRNAGWTGPRTSKNRDTGWTNPEAARAIAEYVWQKKAKSPSLLNIATVDRFTRDHSERNARRAKAQQELKDARRKGTESGYVGHEERVSILRGRFKNLELENIALSSEVVTATLYFAAKYSPQQDDLDDFFPREGSYRKPHADQGGLFRSNLAIHAKQYTLKDLRRAARAVRSILHSDFLYTGWTYPARAGLIP